MFVCLQGNQFRWYIYANKLPNMRQIVDAVVLTYTDGDDVNMDNLLATMKTENGVERLDFSKLRRGGFAHGHYAAYPMTCTMGYFAFNSRSKGGDHVGEGSRDWINVRESALFTKRSVYFDKDQLVEKTSDVTFPAEYMRHLKVALDYTQERLNESMYQTDDVYPTQSLHPGGGVGGGGGVGAGLPLPSELAAAAMSHAAQP